MTNEHLAFLVIRFSAFSFLYYAFLELPDLINYYRDFATLHAASEDTALANQNFARVAFRIGLEFLAALLLLARTRQVISFLAFGRWNHDSRNVAEPTGEKS